MSRPDAGNLLALLAIAIALSAYLATIRMMQLQRLQDASLTVDQRLAIKRSILYLVLADAPLVLAGVFLFVHLFWKEITGSDPGSRFLPAALWCFAFACLILLVLHVWEWSKAIWVNCSLSVRWLLIGGIILLAILSLVFAR